MNELLGADVKTVEEPVRPVKAVKVAKPVEDELPVIQEIEPEIDFTVQKTAAEVPATREEAVIPKDMVITGNINTKSNMKIMGSIIGDVECEGNIFLLGNIKGNVSAGNLSICKGGLTGDAFVKADAVVEEDSVMIGNITAQNIYTNAKIEGQLKATGTVELKENASIQGDITAGTISMNAGAKIKGMVNISE